MATRLVGTPVKRLDDPKLITGKGNYVDDIKIPNMLYAYFYRSPIAHGIIKKIDISNAYMVEGVIAVFTGKDLADLGPLRKHGMQGMKEPDVFPLAVDKVRYVGEPVVLCIAETPTAARDAAELIEVEYEQLPAVVNAEEAIESNVLLYDNLGSNVSLQLEFKGGDIDAAFNEADRIIRKKLKLNRTTGAPMETRGSVAYFNPVTHELTLWSSTQFPHVYRGELARYFSLPENRVRVIACDIGGGFGVKVHFFREDFALCYASMKLGRPVKWVETRAENLAASIHEREQIHYVEIAVKHDGTILGIKDKCIADLGAFGAPPWGGGALSMFTSVLLPGPYKLKGFISEHLAVFTNKGPYGAVRGPALIQANFIIERIIDIVAHELNLDPAEVRLKNLVKTEDLPFTTLTGQVYTSTSFDKTFEKLLNVINYKQLREEQRRKREEGKYMGVGFSILVEYGAFGSAVNALFGMGGYDSVMVRIEPSGKVSVYSGLIELGQGIKTALAQVVADKLQIPIEDITVYSGDTLYTPYGIGSHSSRGGIIGGNAAAKAVEKIISKMKKIAATLLEANETDIEYESGKLYVRDAPDKSVSLQEVITTAYVNAHKLPQDVEPGLEAVVYYEPTTPITWANAAHAAVVEVDTETGEVKVLDYYVVEDCGNVINPTIAVGQIVGGVVQGIGHVVYEDLTYDNNGTLLTQSFMDYLLPSALDIPNVKVEFLITPAGDNPGGYKGLGEGGTIAAPAALANAVEDALQPFNTEVTDTPLTPYNVWKMMQTKQ